MIPERRSPDQVTEFHVGIEYEFSLFQTRAGYEQFFGWMSYKHAGLSAEMDKDMFKEGENFKPYQIQMPANVASALTRIYDSIPEAHPGITAAEWISSVKLGTNFVTRHIFALWHCTGPKEFIKSEFPKFWFFPYAKSLLKSSSRPSRVMCSLRTRLLMADDGRTSSSTPRTARSSVARTRTGLARTVHSWVGKNSVVNTTRSSFMVRRSSLQRRS